MLKYDVMHFDGEVRSHLNFICARVYSDIGWGVTRMLIPHFCFYKQTDYKKLDK